jgi:beta-lactamase regulating signal transducer with metallopeptidase domain
VVDALLHGLLAQTLALSLAAGAVRALQASALRRFGAGAAYLCWLLVPVAMLATALPHPAAALVVHVDVSTLAPAWIIAAPVAVGMAGHGVALAIAVAWLAGAVSLGALLALRQRRFEATLTRTGDAVPRLPAGAGPAVLGVLRPRIALPCDFDAAFDARERRLMLLHEQVHLRRRDNAWNLLASALLVLHWFNPIAWWAAACLRADQELACDAAVLRRESPDALATYAGALLKVQGVALTPPLATTWQSSHPLVQRIRMLQLHRLSPARHRAGLRLAALSILVAGVGGYGLRAGANATPAPGPAGASVMTSFEVQIDSKDKVAWRLLTRTGQKAMALANDDVVKKALAGPIEIAYTVTRLEGDRLQIDATLRQGEPLATLASPRLVTRDGEAARVEVKSADGAHAFAVTMLPKLLPRDATSPDDAGDMRQLPRTRPLPALPPLRAEPAPPVPAVDAVPAVPPTSALPPPPANLPPPPQRAL